MDHGWEVVVTHLYREANRVTDALAHHCYSMNEASIFFADCPIDYTKVLKIDVMRIVTP